MIFLCNSPPSPKSHVPCTSAWVRDGRTCQPSPPVICTKSLVRSTCMLRRGKGGLARDGCYGFGGSDWMSVVWLRALSGVGLRAGCPKSVGLRVYVCLHCTAALHCTSGWRGGRGGYNPVRAGRRDLASLTETSHPSSLAVALVTDGLSPCREGKGRRGAADGTATDGGRGSLSRRARRQLGGRARYEVLAGPEAPWIDVRTVRRRREGRARAQAAAIGRWMRLGGGSGYGGSDNG